MTLKRRAKSLTVLAIIAASLGLGTGAALAAGDSAIVAGTTNHSLYKAGRDVNITGTVNGDIFCAGQTITVDATVNGDVICAGQTVTVTGSISGNVRLAGQSVTLGADVKHAASLAGQDVTIQSNARIGSDLSLAAQTATVDGRVGRDIRAASNTLGLDSVVGRNVDATVNKVELTGGAVINGDLTYSSPNRAALHRQSGAQVIGQLTGKLTKTNNGNRMAWRGAWVLAVYWAVIMVVFALVLVALFPQFFSRWNQVARSRPGWSLLTGFVAMFVVPAIIVALLASIIGVPLGLFLLGLWLIEAALSGPVAAYYLGSQILRAERRIPLVMLVGAVVLMIVYLIPVIGWLIMVLAYWLGSGTLLLNLKRAYPKPNYRAR